MSAAAYFAIGKRHSPSSWSLSVHRRVVKQQTPTALDFVCNLEFLAIRSLQLPYSFWRVPQSLLSRFLLLEDLAKLLLYHTSSHLHLTNFALQEYIVQILIYNSFTKFLLESRLDSDWDFIRKSWHKLFLKKFKKSWQIFENVWYFQTRLQQQI